MDKIFEKNVIEQDSVLCESPPEILKISSKYLPTNDVVHLSHTCKELHKKLPFYLMKSVTYIVSTSLKACSLFEGPAINFCISEINISCTVPKPSIWFSDIAVWIQIISQEIVIQETQKYLIKYTAGKLQIKIKNSTLNKFKAGNRLRFMVQQIECDDQGKVDYIFQISVQLENYENGKPIYITEKVKGYAGFRNRSVFVDIEDASESYKQSFQDLHLSLPGYLKYPAKGNTNF